MLKKYLLILIATFGLISTSGCSLFSSDSEETEEAVAEETTSDEEVADSTEETVADSEDEEEVVDEYPDDDYGDDSSATTVAKTDDEALPDQPVEGNQEETLFVGSDDSAASASTTAEEPVPTETAPVEDTSSSTVADTYVPAPTFIPVKSMKKTPFDAGGVMMNRLYIARDNDTISTVAEKIYGDSSRSSDLLAWNPHFKGKSLKVGDKVYYSSPKNPTDSSQIMLYYEEAGIQPSYYTGKSGDSLRKVSKNLLGHPDSWKEIWATNDLGEEKWALAEGAQVRYWPEGTTAPVQTQAAVEEAPPVPEETTPPPAPEQAAAVEETPPMEETAPTMDDSGAAAMAQTEEPPPPPEASAPPPPPAPIAPPEPPGEEASGGLVGMMGGGEDDSMMMAALGGLMIVAALILLVFIRRGRKKVNYG